MTERMQIAIHAMCALLQKDYKNVAFSAYNTGHKDASSYIAEQAFVLADAMIEREKMITERIPGESREDYDVTMKRITKSIQDGK